MTYDLYGLLVVSIFAGVLVTVFIEWARQLVRAVREERRRHTATAGDPVRAMTKNGVLRR